MNLSLSCLVTLKKIRNVASLAFCCLFLNMGIGISPPSDFLIEHLIYANKQN